MPTIKLEAGQVGAAIRQDAKAMRRAMQKGTLSAAHKARTRLVRESPVDRGLLKNAWELKKGPPDAIGVEVENSAPYAGVIERGARPGGVYGRNAVEAIAGWVKRKLLKAHTGGDVDAEALRIAKAIVDRFRRKGRAGKFFVKKLLPAFTRDVHEEVLHEVKKYFANRRGVNV